jgi:hypothetical protein
MRKRSAYRPKPVRYDTMGWVMAGLKPVGSVPQAGVGLKLANLAAMDALIMGAGLGIHSHTMREAFDMAVCMTLVSPRLGTDWLPEIEEAKAAAYAAHEQGERTGQFFYTSEQVALIRAGMEIHLQQIEECTLMELERAVHMARTQKGSRHEH